MNDKNKKTIKVTSGIAIVIGILTMFLVRNGSLSAQMVIGVMIIIIGLPLLSIGILGIIKGVKGSLWLTLAIFSILMGCFLGVLDSYFSSKGINNKFLKIPTPSTIMLFIFSLYMSAKSSYSVEKLDKIKYKFLFILIGFGIFQLLMIYGAFFSGR